MVFLSSLVQKPPFGPRDDAQFLAEMNALCAFHRQNCPPYARICAPAAAVQTVEELPFLHVGLFKHIELRTCHPGLHHGRILLSSSTNGQASRIVTDRQSSTLQSRSAAAIFTSFLGAGRRPLWILDSAKSLHPRTLSARLAAALSLRPLATKVRFLLEEADDPASLAWSTLSTALDESDDLLIYGFTWVLWTAWAAVAKPAQLRDRLAGKRVCFVHSGGWKRLESLRVERSRFDAALLDGVAPGSRVVDFYGLVEQMGIVYPLCECGARHVPCWADVLVRDPYTLAPLPDAAGQLQLLNALAWGTPCHSVLTEDVGRLVPGPCPAGRSGRRFELLGRVPKAQLRGCANV